MHFTDDISRPVLRFFFQASTSPPSQRLIIIPVPCQVMAASGAGAATAGASLALGVLLVSIPRWS